MPFCGPLCRHGNFHGENGDGEKNRTTCLPASGDPGAVAEAEAGLELEEEEAFRSEVRAPAGDAEWGNEEPTSQEEEETLRLGGEGRR